MNKSWLRYRNGILIAIAVILGLTLLLAPAQTYNRRGSTYNRAPDGYGAWYAYLEQQGTPIQRWRKPLAQWLQEPAHQTGTTLLQVGNPPTWQQDQLSQGEAIARWLDQGNRLIVLAAGGEATAAPFQTVVATKQGAVTLETKRRHRLATQESALLADTFGAIVWSTAAGRIEAVTPHLAANAYQDAPGNFAWLADLVGAKDGAKDGAVWVNEFSHGYRDREQRLQAGLKTWGDYFLRTPLLLIGVQGLVLLIVAIVAQNRRWGPIQPVVPPIENNSEAYVQALAGVLRRAGCTGFVRSQWQAAEQRRLQRFLGLGDRRVDLDELCQVWEQQTGQAAAELRQLLSDPNAKASPSEANLRHWLRRWPGLEKELEKPKGK